MSSGGNRFLREALHVAYDTLDFSRITRNARGKSSFVINVISVRNDSDI